MATGDPTAVTATGIAASATIRKDGYLPRRCAAFGPYASLVRPAESQYFSTGCEAAFVGFNDAMRPACANEGVQAAQIKVAESRAVFVIAAPSEDGLQRRNATLDASASQRRLRAAP